MARRQTANRKRGPLGSATLLGLALISTSAAAVVFGAAGTDFSLNSTPGILSISGSSTAPASDILIAGTSENHVAAFAFTASGDDVLVDTITLHNCVMLRDTDGDCADKTERPGDSEIIESVTITYPRDDGAATSTTAVMDGDVVTFGDLDFIVADGATEQVQVYASVHNIDGATTHSNSLIQLNLNAVAQPFSAVGVNTRRTLTQDTKHRNTRAEQFVVKLSRPTISLSSASPSGPGIPGTVEVLRFNMSASATGDIEVEQLTFGIAASDNDNSGWNMCDTDGGSTAGLETADFSLYNRSQDIGTPLETADSDWTLWTAAGAPCNTTAETLGYATLHLPDPEEIPRGATYTYSLYMNTSGASTEADDQLRVDLLTEPVDTVWNRIAHASNANIIGTRALDVDTPSEFWLGDVICIDTDDDAACDNGEEQGLVNSCDPATGSQCTSDLVFVRGYLGTNLTPNDKLQNTDDVLRLPGTLLWTDGEEYWGGWLVNDLPLNGGTIAY